MKKILIIEDDSIVAHVYQKRLEKEGFEAEVANDGHTGFQRIQQYCPDAVLLDLMLPKMNGIDILKKIRHLAQFARTPVIVFTNAYVPNMVQDAFGAGATQVFNKATVTPRQIIDSLSTSISVANRNATDTRNNSTDPADATSAQATGESANATAEDAAAPPAPVVLPSAENSMVDNEFQMQLLRGFSEKAPETITTLRRCMQEFVKSHDHSHQLPSLLQLYRRVHALTSSAGIAGLRNISHMSSALEVLLKELYEKPKNINPSTLRTVASSIDFIGELFTQVNDVDLLESAPVSILVVDDEILSRRAITYAIEKANLKSVSVDEGQMALNMATQSCFDLIFLDVQMPGMDGFELCSKIRALPTNRNTAIIFVTSLTDFKSRARSSLSGGSDLIAKPFMFIELSVKALTYVLRGRASAYRQAIAV